MQKKRFPRLASLLLIALCIFWSCDKDFHPVGIDLFEGKGFDIQSETYPVYLYQDKMERVQTDGLSLGQLGEYTHPVFGKTKAQITSQLQINPNPIFGTYNQDRENEGDEDNPRVIQENERVTDVFLEIPFFTNRKDSDQDGVIDQFDLDPDDNTSDSDGDGISDLVETRGGTNPLDRDSDGDGIEDDEDDDSSSYDAQNGVYEIDSLYGNTSAQFTLKVQELTYYLSTLDPSTSFATNKPYFNDMDFSALNFTGETLFEDQITLNFEELRFNYTEDDPETEEDETTKIEERLTPRIRVPLASSFFQERLLDKEGSEVLKNLNNFKSYIKGLIIQTDQMESDLLMLLDINNAVIKVNFTYDRYNDKGTTDDLTDDIIEEETETYIISLGGVQYTTLSHGSHNSEILNAVQVGAQNKPSEKIYIQGGKFRARVNLFGEDPVTQKQAVTPIKKESRLITQANLKFYVSDLYKSNTSLYLPERLYLYLDPSGKPLPDYDADKTQGIGVTNGDKYVLGGMLQYTDGGIPSHYSFIITENINTLLGKVKVTDGTVTVSDYDNFSMGLVLGADIENIALRKAVLSDNRGEIDIPTTSVLNPFGVELWGNASSFKAAELELLYNVTRR